MGAEKSRRVTDQIEKCGRGKLTQAAREKGAAARRQAAIEFYRPLLFTITTLKNEGLSFGRIADELNGQGHKTKRGGRFIVARSSEF